MVEYDGTNIPPEVVASLPPYLQAQVPLWRETMQPEFYAILAICHTAACIAVFLRLYSRRLKGVSLWADDYFIIVSLMFNIVYLGTTVALAYIGIGRHTVVTVLNHPGWLISATKIEWTGGIFNFLPLTFSKFSILCFYHRIFSGGSARFKWTCISFAIFVTAFGLASIFSSVFHCIPVAATWDLTITSKTCTDFGTELIALAGINVVTDAMILVLPMPIVWRMTTSLSRKLEISGIFLLGSVAIFASIIRACYAGLPPVFFMEDPLWVATRPFMWSNVESCIAIVAACLPILRPILNKVIYGHADGSRAGRAGESRVSYLPGASRSARLHLVTIGGGIVPLQPHEPLPGGGAAKTRGSSISTAAMEEASLPWRSQESV